MADVKTVDNSEAQAAREANETKTVDNSEAQAATEANETKTVDNSEEGNKSEEGNTSEEANETKTVDNSEAQTATETDESKAVDSSEEADEPEESLTDEELSALDAKVRRRVSKVQRENANLRGRLKSAEADNAKLTVALNAGLDGEMLKFLSGDTVEELENNAADLLAMLGLNGRVTPSSGPVERGSNPRRGSVDPATAAANETNLDNIGARIYRR